MTSEGSNAVADVRDLDLVALDDEQFNTLVLLVAAEQQRRALSGCDPDALIEEGFRDGFGPVPQVKDPWVRDGLLVAPGGRFDRGGTTHRCSFAKVDGQWVWEHPAQVSDVIRRPDRQGMRSVTVVALSEGSRVDLVSARCRNGTHTVSAVRSFQFHDGRLVMVDARTVAEVSHR